MATMGRPSKYTPQIADAICSRMALGETVRDICKDATMPDERTVRRWAIMREDFRPLYAQAREEQADALADEALERARSSRENYGADRLAVDTLKWAASKMKPRTYSDKLQVENSGDQTIRVVVEYADDPPAAE